MKTVLWLALVPVLIPVGILGFAWRLIVDAFWDGQQAGRQFQIWVNN